MIFFVSNILKCNDFCYSRKNEDIAPPDGQPDVGPRKVTEDEML